jgi:hypothetical protein
MGEIVNVSIVLIYIQRLVDAQVILDSPALVPVVLMSNMLIHTNELKFETSACC